MKRYKKIFISIVSSLILLFLLLFIIKDSINNVVLEDNLSIEQVENNKEVIEEISPEDEVKELLESIPKEEKIQSIKIVAGGDVMFHMPQVNGAYNDGVYNFESSFTLVEEIFEDGDLTILNYETTASDKDYSGFPRFASPYETIEALANSGVDVLATANNHCLDRGKEGIITTIEQIEKNDMDYVGTSKEMLQPLLKDLNGIKLGILSYTYGLNGLDTIISDVDRYNMIGLIDRDRIKADIEEIRNECDFVIVFIHWGTEYQRNPSTSQIELAEDIFDYGGDIILGSHPHVVQRAEMRDDNKFVIYSMGNFLSNQREQYLNEKYVEDGVLVELTLEKNITKKTTTIKNVEYIPTWVHMYNDGRLRHVVVPLIKGKLPEIYEDSDEYLKDRMIKSYNDTMDVLQGE